jgi:hypothetical protein
MAWGSSPHVWKSILPSLPWRLNLAPFLPLCAGHASPSSSPGIPNPVRSITYHNKTPDRCHFTFRAGRLVNHTSAAMDSTLSCLLLLPPSVQRRSYRSKVTERDHDGPGTGSSVVKASRGRRRRAGGRRFCVKALFGDGGGDGFQAIRRMVKLNSAIQNRSVRELIELVGDECLYFFRNIRSTDLLQMSKVKKWQRNSYMRLGSISPETL